jgi:hypothetical protein
MAASLRRTLVLLVYASAVPAFAETLIFKPVSSITHPVLVRRCTMFIRQMNSPQHKQMKRNMTFAKQPFSPIILTLRN